MLNIQKTIIVCVLLAAVWVQSSKATLSPKDQQKINNLVESLERVRKNSTLRGDGINHFVSWGRWGAIPDTAKLEIAFMYANDLGRAGKDHASAKTEASKNEIAPVAYLALNSFVNREMQRIGVKYQGISDIVGRIQQVKDQGKFLDYFASTFEYNFNLLEYLRQQ